MLFERRHTKNRKQHIKYFNFRSKNQLDHSVKVPQKGGSFTSTTSVDGSTNVVFESSSRTVKRSSSDATRDAKEGESLPNRDRLEQSVEGAKGPKNNLDNTSYHEFVWEGGDDNSGTALTLIPTSLFRGNRIVIRFEFRKTYYLMGRKFY